MGGLVRFEPWLLEEQDLVVVFREAALQMADVLLNGLQPWMVLPIASLGWEIFSEDLQLPLQAAPFRFQICQAHSSLLGCLHENLLEALGVLAHFRDLLDHDPLHGTGWDGLRGAMFPTSLLSVGADVIAVALATLARIRRAHGTAARPAIQKAFQDRSRPVPLGRALVTMALEQILHLLPFHRIDNGWMFATVEFFFVAQLAGVSGVPQELMQVRFDEGLATHLASLASHPNLGPPAPALQLPNHRKQGLVLQVKIKDGSDSGCFLRVDHQPENLGVNVVAQDRHSSRPLPLTPRRCDLVARALGDDLTLELGERKKNVQHQPAHGGRAIELLGDGHEGDVVLFQDDDDAGEVQYRATEPIQ